MLRPRYTLLSLLVACSLVAAAFVSVVTAQPDPGCPTPTNPLLQTDPGCYHASTGHVIREPFYSYFVRTGGVGRYGDPITDDYVDPHSGMLIQYFDNARLEWHPANPEPYRVQLGLLGEQLGKLAPPIPVSKIPSANDPNCSYFQETGHTLCYNFREHWLKHGGLDSFGYPITEYMIENGMIVQYFQRAKMEWHPQKPEGERVQLAPLGRSFFEFAGLPRYLLEPNRNSFGLSLGQGEQPITALVARASAMFAVTGQGGTQTGFVYVTDQLGNPIKGAAVTMIVMTPTRQIFTLPGTAEDGTAYQTFQVGAVKPGRVVDVEFVIAYRGFQTSTRTSFMVWFQ